MSLSFGLRLPGMGVSQAISNIRGQMRSALPFVLFLGGAGKQGAGHSILFQIKLMAYFYCYYSLSRWLFQVLWIGFFTTFPKEGISARASVLPTCPRHPPSPLYNSLTVYFLVFTVFLSTLKRKMGNGCSKWHGTGSGAGRGFNKARTG